MSRRGMLILLMSGLMVGPSLSSGPTSWFAVVRSDGLLIPFAQFDGSSWKTCWPEAGSETDIELRTLSDIPSAWLGELASIPIKWTFLSVNHNISELRSLKPIKADSYAQSIWGITTDYSPVTKVEHQWPYPKAGLAFSGSPEVTLPESIDPRDAGAELLAAFVKGIFEHKEDELVQKDPAQARYGDLIRGDIPLDRELRRKNAVDIRSLTKVSETIYYFDCDRTYSSRERPIWPDTLNMNGWINEDKGHFDLIESNMTEGGPTAAVRAYRILGQVVADGQLYAIAVMEFYEWESFAILRIKKNSLEIICRMWMGIS